MLVNIAFVEGTGQLIVAAPKNLRYSYDALGRRLTITDFGTASSTSFGYDLAGNRMSEVVDLFGTAYVPRDGGDNRLGPPGCQPRPHIATVWPAFGS